MTDTHHYFLLSVSQSTLNYIALGWIGLAVIIFPYLLKTISPYGRYADKYKGPMINNKLSWFFMEVPSFAVILWFFYNTPNLENKMVLTAYMLWIIHYFNRAFIFPLRLRTKKKKMPLSIMLSGAFFNIVNAWLNGYWLANFAPKTHTDLLDTPHYIIGVAVFIIGFIINQYHDTILIHLRKFNTGYKIPHGGLFKYVSCPNYLGEILEWVGFAILCWNLPALSFAIWTMANLIPRALNHHKWYKQKFEHYPESRKAIFPRLL
ncbi:MAG: DUF1295 domain-containing protein [Chlorobi bacterium]|nr:DUF1295 domain-containing protein [Chlorobiota bacterium]